MTLGVYPSECYSSGINLCDAFLRHFGRSIISIHYRKRVVLYVYQCNDNGLRVLYRVNMTSCIVMWYIYVRHATQLGRCYVRLALKCLLDDPATRARRFKPCIISLQTVIIWRNARDLNSRLLSALFLTSTVKLMIRFDVCILFINISFLELWVENVAKFTLDVKYNARSNKNEWRKKNKFKFYIKYNIFIH